MERCIGSTLDHARAGSGSIACVLYQSKSAVPAKLCRLQVVSWVIGEAAILAHVDVFAGEHAGNPRWNAFLPSLFIAVGWEKEGL